MYDLYASSRNDRWRFVLGKAGPRPLFTIGLNPSTATREKADITVAKVERVAQRHGFDGFVLLNLYPVRATDCRTLPLSPDDDAFQRNLAVIEAQLADWRAPSVWAAWGANITLRRFFPAALCALQDRLRRQNVQWRRFGPPTAAGHPRHPSRLAYAWTFAPFDMVRYVAMLSS